MLIFCEENGLSLDFNRDEGKWCYCIDGVNYVLEDNLHDSSVSLIPILRVGYEEINKKLEKVAGLEHDSIVHLYEAIIYSAIETDSMGWIELAIKWIEDSNYSIGKSLIYSLRSIGKSKRYSQNLRQRAIKAARMLI